MVAAGRHVGAGLVEAGVATMSNYYTYEDDLHWTFRITPINDGDYAHVLTADEDGRGVGIAIPADERQAAAQALAGDEWRVVSAKQPGKPDPIDPQDVRVGDVVEVKANDGSWMVRGKVSEIGFVGADYPFRIHFDELNKSAIWPCVPGNTVRLLRRAEPEPDPVQVKALDEVLSEVESEIGYSSPQLARELVRRGVTVAGGRDD